MSFLRHAALRAVSASTRQIQLAPRTARSISTVKTTAQRPRLSLASSLIQRRFASEDAAKTEEAKLAELAANAAEAAPADTVVSGKASESAQKEAVSNAIADVDGGVSAATDAATTSATSNASRGPRPKFHTAYVGNLSFEITEEQLGEIFGEFGNITQCRLVKDHRGLPRGFGFVSYDSAEALQNAIKAMDGKTVLERSLFVAPRTRRDHPAPSGDRQFRPSVDPSTFPPSRTIYIGNMSWQMTDKDLTDLFRGIRNVVDVRVAIDRATGHPRGFAHADFVDVESATAAKAALDEKVIYDRSLKVNFAHESRPRPRRDGPPQGERTA